VVDNESLIWRVRDTVYAAMLERGRPPTPAAVSVTLGVSPDVVTAALEQLHDRHALFLSPGTHKVRMAHPFSGVPTAFRVTAGGRQYWANCAWDALGIPAALHSDARIIARTGDRHEPLQLDVLAGHLHGWDGVVHFPLPFRRWYDDLIQT
jgi:hypothetical protein